MINITCNTWHQWLWSPCHSCVCVTMHAYMRVWYDRRRFGLVVNGNVLVSIKEVTLCRSQLVLWWMTMSGVQNLSHYTLCLKKVPTFKLSVTLSNLNRFSNFSLRFLPYLLNMCRKFQFLVSRGNVATCLRWDGYCRMVFIANFIHFPAVQRFWKSVKIWESYGEFKGGNFSLDTMYNQPSRSTQAGHPFMGRHNEY